IPKIMRERNDFVMRARCIFGVFQLFLEKKTILILRSHKYLVYDLFKEVKKMEERPTKISIRLNKKELRKAAFDSELETRAQIAEHIGVSVTQLYRACLSPDHPNYNSPGPTFIAGVLKAFGEPFERFFFLDENYARTHN
ncbi:hypothetical protein, partial [Peribacillus sp. NPDC056705]|uniref:hypothetical protein n=1 Tax=Peribacillus sp. NPDC056705 TaxID=3345918 RepID=UPI003747C7FA